MTDVGATHQPTGPEVVMRDLFGNKSQTRGLRTNLSSDVDTLLYWACHCTSLSWVPHPRHENNPNTCYLSRKGFKSYRCCKKQCDSQWRGFLQNLWTDSGYRVRLRGKRKSRRQREKEEEL